VKSPLPLSPRSLRAPLLALALAGCAALIVPAYHGPPSDHFDGLHFHNYERTPENQFGDFLAHLDPIHRRGPWAKWETLPTDTPPPRVGPGELRVTFVNHATVLIQLDGLNILTDPVWSERVSPFSFVGPERHRNPGIRFDDLPRIDVVLVSHDHYDHMDLATLARLVRRFHPRIITGLGAGHYLASQGIAGAEEIDWWDAVSIGAGLRIVGVPARHWAARSLDDRNLRLWLGFLIETPSGSVYFAGDTGFTGSFAVIRDRAREPIRLALLPISPALPREAMAGRHMSPRDAVRAARILGAETSIAIHFGTFRQGDDGQREPLDSLAAALATEPQRPPRFWALANGEARDVPALAWSPVGGRR
jgi:L-ascorbate metabolism protein UlaG (beta-lactamase superfamily)